jgi:hypothetical protein
VDDVSVSEHLPAHFIDLGAGEARTGVDFGDQRMPRPGEIRGTVWSDRDGDGGRDTNEPGLAGVNVHLDLDGNGRWTPDEPSAATDGNGAYQLRDVPPGSYRVALVSPADHAQTFPVPTLVHDVTVTEDQVVSGIDFGSQPLPDLMGVTFDIVEGSARWGDAVTVRYALANRGAGVAVAFDVALYLSGDSHIDTTDTLLQTLPVANLAAGAMTEGTWTVTLPGTVTEPRDVFLGLRIDAANTVAESQEGNNDNRKAGADRDWIAVVRSGAEAEPNDSPATATTLALPSQITASITAGDRDFYRITLAEPGRLKTGLRATGFAARLSLFDAKGNVLIQSDGQSPDNPEGLIDQHLSAVAEGTEYFLRVEGIGGGSGDYVLTTDYRPASPPATPIPTEVLEPSHLALGDFNGDGIMDIVDGLTEEMAVLLGRGDGTFWRTVPAKFRATFTDSLVVTDFNRDGRNDVAFVTRTDNAAGVLLGRGDGTFEEPRFFAVGETPYTLTVGDFNEDGVPDLAALNWYSANISVLLGRGDGTFEEQVLYAAPADNFAFVAGDYDNDGHLDLMYNAGNGPGVLLGNGDGTFREVVVTAAPVWMFYLAAGDFNRDGQLDFVGATGWHVESKDATVGLLLGRGDGTFQDQVFAPLGRTVVGITTGDFNRDGWLDVALSGEGDGLGILMNQAGTLTAPSWYTSEVTTGELAAADFNADGHLDLATTDARSSSATIFLGRGDGTFPDLGRVPSGPYGYELAAGDFNGDNRLDLATSTLTALGLGDGTFQMSLPNPPFPGGGTMFDFLTADFNRDGILDLAGTYITWNSVAIFLGRGDGTWQAPREFDLGSAATPWTLDKGDFNGDGLIDLAVANLDADDVAILLGRGDGSFEIQAQRLSVPGALIVLTGDLNGDGRTDLLVAGAPRPVDLAVFLGNGDGTFVDPIRFSTGQHTNCLILADVNHDGRPDIVFTNRLSAELSILLGRGDGTFDPETRHGGVGSTATFWSLADDDFNHDSHLDLAVYTREGEVVVLMGQGDGTFVSPVRYQAGGSPGGGITASDFNQDGQVDLAVTDPPASEIFLLLGQGDGTFQAPLHNALATTLTAVALATGDLNRDGQTDIVAARPGANDAGVLLAVGDGSFEEPLAVPAGTAPVAVVTADFNRDGRLDVAAANYGSGDITVSLGLGDGTYQPAGHFAVGARPTSLVAGDFNRDGFLDLAASGSATNEVSVLLGQGDGTFASQAAFPVGELPVFLTSTDFDGDGRLDLLAANYFSGDVSVLSGRGDGTFAPQTRLPIGAGPRALAVADFNRDGRPDLAAAHPASNEVTVLLAQARGPFQPVRLAVGQVPLALTAADLDGDGIVDLAVANNNSGDVSVLHGRGDGTFAQQVRFPAGQFPAALVSADINGDGLVDLVAANQRGLETTVLLGLGDGTFVPAETVSSAIRSTPLVADLNRDGTADAVVLSRAGSILFRQGRPDAPGNFAPPRVVNPEPADAARDLALVRTATGPILAALDAHRPAVTLYVPGFAGLPVSAAALTVPGALPVRLKAGDLDGDGRDDLVVLAGGSRQVVYFLQDARGGFGAAHVCGAGVGVSPVDLALVDLDGDRRLDVAVLNQYSGDVSVLLNSPAAPLATESRFRAGGGPFAAEELLGASVVRSHLGSDSLATGYLDGNPGIDLLVSNAEANSFTILTGTGSGGLFNPQSSAGVASGAGPTRVVTGRFNGDPYLDVAVLEEQTDRVVVFLGDGRGGFTQVFARDAGQSPTGLSAHDVSGDGILDLLVGNGLGDLLVLPGNGDGTFQPYQRAEHTVTLAVADLDGDGADDFIYANKGVDRVSVSYSVPDQRFLQDRSQGVLAPGAVRLAELNGDGKLDLIVVNSGGNDVLVYPGVGGGQFATARRFFVGTNPAGVSIADLNADRLPDLVVANQGSNDVSILLGQGQGDDWTLSYGPRLAAGAGPSATSVADVTGDGVVDIQVSNSLANTVWQLNGLGQGFFNDISPTIYAVGVAPGPLFVGNFDAAGGLDLVTVNAGSNDVTLYSGMSQRRDIPSEGVRPVAAALGDFNHDGLSDLLVANNGDGVFALMLGDSDGPRLAQLFTRGDLAHPTDLIVDGDGDVYATTEGSESAVLLTSFGVAIAPFGEEPAPNVPVVLVLSGPGFPTDVDLPGGLDAPYAALEGPAAPAGPEELAEADNHSTAEGASLSSRSPAADRASPGASEGGDSAEESDAEAAAAPDATESMEDEILRLMMGLDEALKKGLNLDPPPPVAPGQPPDEEPTAVPLASLECAPAGEIERPAVAAADLVFADQDHPILGSPLRLGCEIAGDAALALAEAGSDLTAARSRASELQEGVQAEERAAEGARGLDPWAVVLVMLGVAAGRAAVGAADRTGKDRALSVDRRTGSGPTPDE